MTVYADEFWRVWEEARAEQVRGFLSRLPLEDLDAMILEARCVPETTRARMIADVLNRALPARVLSRRLARLSFGREWQGASLALVSLSGTVAVERAGKGCCLAPPAGGGARAGLLAVFPELAPLALSALILDAPAGAGMYVAGTVTWSGPGAGTGQESGDYVWDLSAVDPTWTISSAQAEWLGCSFDEATGEIQDPVGSDTCSMADPDCIIPGWGANVAANAGNAAYGAGTAYWRATGNPAPMDTVSVTYPVPSGVDLVHMRIYYTTC